MLSVPLAPQPCARAQLRRFTSRAGPKLGKNVILGLANAVPELPSPPWFFAAVPKFGRLCFFIHISGRITSGWPFLSPFHCLKKDFPNARNLNCKHFLIYTLFSSGQERKKYCQLNLLRAFISTTANLYTYCLKLPVTSWLFFWVFFFFQRKYFHEEKKLYISTEK